jgi:hypothetical protein
VAQLILTITGPFAYVDNTACGNPINGYITLMAPMCPQHKAGLAGIEPGNQYIFGSVNCRNHKAGCADCQELNYQLLIGAPGSTVTIPSGLKTYKPPKPPKYYDGREWRFWLTLPRPDYFVEINPVEATIIEGGTTKHDHYAIGMRFVYNNWDGNGIKLRLNGRDVPDPHEPEKPLSFKFPQGTPGILELDYAAPLRDDDQHEDAVDCFESLMNTLGFRYSIYIHTGRNLFASKLNDCKAAIAFITDYPLGDGTAD